MGQYFYLVNLDKRQTFGCYGKFGEWFFCGLGDRLTSHLQRRLTPPLDPLPSGGKQLKGLRFRNPSSKPTDPEREKTRAMGRELLYGADSQDGSSEDEDSDDDFIGITAWRLKRIRPIPRRLESGLATINELPNELLSMIFSFLLVDESSYESALSFAITNSHLWDVGKTAIASFITSRETTADYWVGDRIVCLGDYAADLPPHVNVEELGIGLGDIDDPDDDSDDDSDDDLGLRALFRLKEPEELPYSFEWSSNAATDRVGKVPGFKPWLHPFKRRDDSSVTVSPENEWVLRNLTKKEYTREDDGRGGSFEHRLIVRSCWSTYIGSICLNPEPERLYHGPWAGDRFDIVPIGESELVKGPDGKVVKVAGWKDVTDELRREIDELFEAEYS